RGVGAGRFIEGFAYDAPSGLFNTREYTGRRDPGRGGAAAEGATGAGGGAEAGVPAGPGAVPEVEGGTGTCRQRAVADVTLTREERAAIVEAAQKGDLV